MTTPPVVEIRGLTRSYGRTVGVEALDLTVEPGEVFGFLGPNGAGKTTTIRLLLDLIRPDRGIARLFGVPSSEPSIRSRVGYLPGELELDGRMTGTATLRFLAALDGVPSARSAPRRADLCRRLGLSTRDLARRVRGYSRGMKQKLGLVSAFQHDPDLLVLDEPTAGLDPLVRETVFELLAEARRAGRTVFHSSHVLSEVARTCDRVAILREGRLAAVMRVDEMRRASARRMEIHFAGQVPRDELDLPGVETLEIDGSRVVLRVTGDPGPLIRMLATRDVRHFAFPEPGLEEAFASWYRTDA
ncbi:MAG: ABC transporter ATP-binding protein [Gemmatimonadota bacterium]